MCIWLDICLIHLHATFAKENLLREVEFWRICRNRTAAPSNHNHNNFSVKFVRNGKYYKSMTIFILTTCQFSICAASTSEIYCNSMLDVNTNVENNRCVTFVEKYAIRKVFCVRIWRDIVTLRRQGSSAEYAAVHTKTSNVCVYMSERFIRETKSKRPNSK